MAMSQRDDVIQDILVTLKRMILVERNETVFHNYWSHLPEIILPHTGEWQIWNMFKMRDLEKFQEYLCSKCMQCVHRDHFDT